MREKFDFSLEPRQVAYYFLVGLVILTLVFALGIIVGRGIKNPSVMPAETAESAPAEDAPVDATSETASPALPGDEEAPKLKFYAEGSSAPVREVSAIAKPVAEAKAPPVVADVEAKPAAERKSEPKAAKEKAAAPAKAAKRESASSSSKRFTIQVSAFQDRGQADHMVSNLKHKGYDAFIAKAAIPGKGVWYRVRIGKYASRDDAQATANKLKRKEGISTYVTLNQ